MFFAVCDFSLRVKGFVSSIECTHHNEYLHNILSALSLYLQGWQKPARSRCIVPICCGIEMLFISSDEVFELFELA